MGKGSLIGGSIGIILGALLITGGFMAPAYINTTLLEPEVPGGIQAIWDEGEPLVVATAYSEYIIGVEEAAIEAFGGEAGTALYINCTVGSLILQQIFASLSGP